MGVIIESNEELAISPELVNRDPYGRDWIALIRPTALTEELEGLLTPVMYAEHVRRLLQG